MRLPRRSTTWLWALILALSAIKAASTQLLPAGSPLHEPLCKLMGGLPACRP